MSTNQETIKSKQRVKDHGEVFTPDFVVNDMLNLVKNETERIESRFLEPACGDGNFLAPILIKKLNIVLKKYGRSQTEFEKNSFIAVSSIYGVDLLEDNIKTCVDRLYKIFDKIYTKKYKNKSKDEFRKNIKYIFSRNVLQGNALTLKTNNDKDYIIFSEWSMISSGMVKRRDFQYAELADFEPNSMIYFSVRETSDIGEKVFSPMPVRDFPLKHYLKFDYENTK
jgi:hypothetical protein